MLLFTYLITVMITYLILTKISKHHDFLDLVQVVQAGNNLSQLNMKHCAGILLFLSPLFIFSNTDIWQLFKLNLANLPKGYEILYITVLLSVIVNVSFDTD